MLRIKRLVAVFLNDLEKDKYSFLIYFILFLQSCFSYGQENAYVNFSVAEGLPSAEVYQVIQDTKGFLWFATDNGVVKYDGGDFEVLTPRQGLSDPVVFGLHEDHYGRIWFRTVTGKLSYYQDGKIYKYAYNDSIVNRIDKGIVSDLYYDTLDQLWITARNQIIRIDKNGNLTTERTSYHSKETIDMRSLNSQKELMTFSGPVHHIHTAQIDHQKFQILLSDTTKDYSYLNIVRWADHKYFSINTDLFQYDDGIKKVFTSLSPIISLSVDKEDRLWIGSLNGGVQRIEDPGFKKTVHIDELSEKSVSKVLQDDEGGFWITTLEKGVFYFPNFSIKKFSVPDNSKISSVNIVTGNLIVTDYSGKITAYNDHGKNILWKKEFDTPIIRTYVSTSSQIWVATTNEMLILNDQGEILKRNLPSINVDFSASASNVYGTNINGLYKFNPNGDLLLFKDLNTRYRNIHYAGNEIYLGGNNGLFLFDSAFNYIRELKDFTDIKVTNITPLTDSVFIISTIGEGFILFNKKSNRPIASYNSYSGFIANNIYCIAIQNDILWIGTEKGIATTHINSLLSGNPDFNFINRLSGLANDKVNFLTLLPGVIWAFSDDGYNEIPLNQLRYINQHPVAYIKEIKINNDPINFQNQSDFNHQQNNIQIKLGFLSFNNRNIFARFRLAPNTPWINSDNWVFASNALSPGKYNFEAEYSTDNLNWFPTNVNLSFEIQPPWWKTWYFLLTAALIILLIGIVIFKRRFSWYEEKNKYLTLVNEQQKKLLRAEIEATERERSRIAKDLHDGIGMDLVSIKFLTNQLAKKSEDKNAQEIQSQLQKTISEIKNIIHGLAPTGLQLFGLSHGLDNYLSMIKRKHSIDINLVYHGEEVKNEQMGTMVFRIIQELVTNSVKHSNCTTISINFITSSVSIQITYQDDGIGFSPDLIRPGLGLSNIRSRVESVDGQITVESDRTGTNYTIHLPLSKQSN